MKTAGVVLMILCLTSCTSSLRTSRDLEPTAGKIYRGLPYSLPRVNFVLDVERELVSCDNGTSVVKTKVSLQEIMTKDSSAVYYLDYEKMKSAAKTVDFNMLTHSETGGIKQISVGVTDHSKDIVVGVVKAGVAVAALATGNPVVAAAVLSDVVPEPNKAELMMALRALPPTLEPECPCSQAAVDQLKLVKRLEAERRVASAGASNEQIKVQLATLNAQIADAKKFLVRTQQYVIDENTPVAEGDFSTAVLDPKHKDQNYKAALKPGSAMVIDWFKPKFRVQGFIGMMLEWRIFAKDSKNPLMANNKCDPGDGADAHGVVCRDPVSGVFVVRSEMKTILTKQVSVPQAGMCFVIPYRNKSFEDNALVMDFRVNGSVEKISYKDKSSRAKGAVDAATASLELITKSQAAAKDAVLQEYTRLKEELELKTEVINKMKAYKEAVESQ